MQRAVWTHKCCRVLTSWGSLLLDHYISHLGVFLWTSVWEHACRCEGIGVLVYLEWGHRFPKRLWEVSLSWFRLFKRIIIFYIYHSSLCSFSEEHCGKHSCLGIGLNIRFLPYISSNNLFWIQWLRQLFGWIYISIKGQQII